MATILQIIQRVVSEGDIQVSSNVTSVVANQDATIQQLKNFAERECEWLGHNYTWPELEKENLFSTSDSVDSYALPEDFDRFLFGTDWNRATRFPLYALTPRQWQDQKSSAIVGFYRTQYRIKGMTSNQFFVHPTPSSTEQLVYEYRSSRYLKPITWATGLDFSEGDYCFYNGNYYQSASAGTSGATAPTVTTGSQSDGGVTWNYFSGNYNRFLSDNDEPVFPESVVTLGILWRYMRQKRLDGWEDIRAEYLSEAGKASSDKRPARRISFSAKNGLKLINYNNVPETGFGS